MLRAFFLFSLGIVLVASACGDDDDGPTSPVEACCGMAPLRVSLGAADIYVPNVFTPDANGVNDFFYIHTNDEIDRIEAFTIRNQSGTVVFQLFGNAPPNENDFGWDGLAQNEQVAGIYDYEFTVVTTDGMTGTFTGQVCSLPCNRDGDSYPTFAVTG